MAAILDLKVKIRSNHQNDAENGNSNPAKPEGPGITHRYKLIFHVVIGSHLGFEGQDKVKLLKWWWK